MPEDEGVEETELRDFSFYEYMRSDIEEAKTYLEVDNILSRLGLGGNPESYQAAHYESDVSVPEGYKTLRQSDFESYKSFAYDYLRVMQTLPQDPELFQHVRVRVFAETGHERDALTDKLRLPPVRIVDGEMHISVRSPNLVSSYEIAEGMSQQVADQLVMKGCVDEEHAPGFQVGLYDLMYEYLWSRGPYSPVSPDYSQLKEDAANALIQGNVTLDSATYVYLGNVRDGTDYVFDAEERFEYAMEQVSRVLGDDFVVSMLAQNQVYVFDRLQNPSDENFERAKREIAAIALEILTEQNLDLPDIEGLSNNLTLDFYSPISPSAGYLHRSEAVSESELELVTFDTINPALIAEGNAIDPDMDLQESIDLRKERLAYIATSYVRSITGNQQAVVDASEIGLSRDDRGKFVFTYTFPEEMNVLSVLGIDQIVSQIE